MQRGFISLGLFRDQQDVDMSPEQFGTVRPGDIKYKDVNGDGVITDDDKVPLFAYSGIPQFMYGFGAEVRYKNWTLNVLFKGTGNNYFLYGDKDGSKFDGLHSLQRRIQGQRTGPGLQSGQPLDFGRLLGQPGDREPQCAVPAPFLRQQRQQHQTLDLLERQCPPYLRLQELSLNYNLHTPGLRKALGLQSIDFQIMCENLAVWDGVEIFDPEQAMQTGHAYPIPAPLLAADLPELLTRISPKNINYHEKIIHHTPRAGRPAHRVVQLPERGRLFRGHPSPKSVSSRANTTSSAISTVR